MGCPHRQASTRQACSRDAGSGLWRANHMLGKRLQRNADTGGECTARILCCSRGSNCHSAVQRVGKFRKLEGYHTGTNKYRLKLYDLSTILLRSVTSSVTRRAADPFPSLMGQAGERSQSRSSTRDHHRAHAPGLRTSELVGGLTNMVKTAYLKGRVNVREDRASPARLRGKDRRGRYGAAHYGPGPVFSDAQ